MPFKVDVLNFPEWAAAWSEPAAADAGAACLFQSPAYLSLWLDTLGRARRTEPLFVKVDTDDDRRVMLLALGLERRRGLKVLSFLDGEVADYAGPVRPGTAAGALDAAGAASLWGAICRALPAFDLAVLDKMPTEIEGVANPLRHLAVEWSPSGWALALDAEPHNPFAADSRRKRRKLQKLGGVSFEIAQDASTARSFLDAMVEQKTRKYLESVGRDLFEEPGAREYYSTFTARQDVCGLVHLSALKVGDRIVATHWGLNANGTFYYLMPAYAKGPTARWSPGRLLMEDLIDWCRRNNVRSFDFGHGDDDYKVWFGARRRPLVRLEAAGSLAGRACLAGLALRRSRPVRSLERRLQALRPRPDAPADDEAQVPEGANT